MAAVLLAGWMGEAGAAVKHVIHVSVDGLRGDFLKSLVEQPASQYFTFARLKAEGAVTYNARCDFSHSITIPNHTSMITGRPVLAEPGLPLEIQHGYLTNYTIPTDLLQTQGSPPGYKHSTFDRVHDRGMRTALLVSKQKLSLFSRSYGPLHGAEDLDGEDHGRNKIDLLQILEGRSAPLIETLRTAMDGDFPAYTFLHMAEPDYAGHTLGWTSEAWRSAVKGADAQLGQLMAALDARPALKAVTAIVLTADHGGGVPDNTHLDPVWLENCIIPVILWGGGIPPGAEAHSLFENRWDPGTAVVGNTYALQPLRNSDTGNIAMALLGLPPVEGSWHLPEFQPRLDILRNLPGKPAGSVTLRWPVYLGGWVLQQSRSLEQNSWTVTAGEPVIEGAFYSQTVSAQPETHWFFRLARTPAAP